MAMYWSKNKRLSTQKYSQQRMLGPGLEEMDYRCSLLQQVGGREAESRRWYLRKPWCRVADQENNTSLRNLEQCIFFQLVFHINTNDALRECLDRSHVNSGKMRMLGLFTFFLDASESSLKRKKPIIIIRNTELHLRKTKDWNWKI